MRKRILSLLAAGATLAAGAGAATALTSTNPLPSAQPVDEGPIACSIETSLDGHAYIIEARVATTEDAGGTYRFILDGGSNGGRTHVQQGGGFFAPAGEPQTLGRLQLGADNARYELTLELDTTLGEKACTLVLGL
ncbi:MAG: hypothetical protein H6873_08690 [Hyphomicrobiaceae bacterium]|nr:hypothetical protein [Hyphomicrobiaceae bacterium]